MVSEVTMCTDMLVLRYSGHATDASSSTVSLSNIVVFNDEDAQTFGLLRKFVGV